MTEALDMLVAHQIIDSLSLHTVGSELDILEGLDLSQYSFKVMVIEHNYNQAKQNMLNAKLSRHGYRRVFPHISKFGAWYVHQNVDTKNLRLGVGN